MADLLLIGVRKGLSSVQHCYRMLLCGQKPLRRTRGCALYWFMR